MGREPSDDDGARRAWEASSGFAQLNSHEQASSVMYVESRV